jgi:hypothetical protein
MKSHPQRMAFLCYRPVDMRFDYSIRNLLSWRLSLVVLVALVALATACQPAAPTDPNSAETQPIATQPGYPTGEDNLSESESYPVPAAVDAAYPVPVQRVVDESKRFAFTEPVKVGAQIVTGTGPASTAIKIISVSNFAEPLGSGVIDDAGVFEIRLVRPVDAQEGIAIQLGDQTLSDQFLDAAGATDIPMLGLVMAQAFAQP